MRILNRPLILGTSLFATVLAAIVSGLAIFDWMDSRGGRTEWSVGRTPVLEPWQLEHERLFVATPAEVRRFLGAWCVGADQLPASPGNFATNERDGIRIYIGLSDNRPFYTMTRLDGFDLTDTLGSDPIFYPARKGLDELFFELDHASVFSISETETENLVHISFRSIDESSVWRAVRGFDARACD